MLLPASEEIQEREQYFALLGRDESDLAAFLAGYFFLNIQKRVPLRRNNVVFRPPLNPLPILNKAGPFALGADLSQIIDFNHRVILSGLERQATDPTGSNPGIRLHSH